MTVEIVTERLLLRDFIDSDLTALAAYQADRRYTEFWAKEAPLDYSRQLFARFRSWAAERPRRNYQLAVAHLRSPAEVIRSCGLRGHVLDAGIAEFGIELAPQGDVPVPVELEN